jgi:hypothetical protein
MGLRKIGPTIPGTNKPRRVGVRAMHMLVKSIMKEKGWRGVRKFELIDIMNQYNEHLLEAIMTGEKVTPFWGFDHMQLVDKKQIVRGKGGKDLLPINWKSTWDLWKKSPELKGKEFIRYLNMESGGYITYPHWHKVSSRVRHASFYRIKTARKLRLLVKEAVESGRKFNRIHDKTRK